MILTRKPTEKLTELKTSTTAKNEEREKGAVATMRLYEGSEKKPDSTNLHHPSSGIIFPGRGICHFRILGCNQR